MFGLFLHNELTRNLDTLLSRLFSALEPTRKLKKFGIQQFGAFCWPLMLGCPPMAMKSLSACETSSGTNRMGRLTDDASMRHCTTCAGDRTIFGPEPYRTLCCNHAEKNTKNRCPKYSQMYASRYK